MIVRTWRGSTRTEDSEAYADVMRRTGLRAFQETEGHLGAMILCRKDGERAEFVVISLWRDLQSVQRFAGATYERAMFYPEDEAYLSARDLHSYHYEVAELRLVAELLASRSTA